MRSLALLLALAVIFPAAAAAAEPKAAQHQAGEIRGRQLVQKNCGMCHAVGREGASPLSAAPPFRDLGRRYSPDDLAEALAEGIITRHPSMPEFRFTPPEVDDIILYMKSIQTRQSAAAALAPTR